MKTSIFFQTIAAAVLTGMLTVALVGTVSARTIRANLSGEGDYSTIQEAVNAAEENDSEERTNYPLLGAHMKKAGGYLRKASRAYTTMPERTLDLIGKEENAYLLMGLTLVILPIELTLSRFYGELLYPYYFGKTSNQLEMGSAYMQNQRASALLQETGNTLRKCRNYGYLSGTIFVGGLGTATYAWFRELGGEESGKLLTAGLAGIFAGRVLRLLHLKYAKLAGKSLELVSGSFPTDTQNELIQKAGKDFRGYANHSYWGYVLQALGVTLALAAKDDKLKTAGATTAFLSWFIFDAWGASNLNSAGERLEDLGHLLVREGVVRSR